MSNSELFSVLFSLLLLVGLAQLLGYLFARLRQPRVIGEILAGIVLGPALFGRFPYITNLFKTADAGHTLGFVYWLGLLLLMFLSGAETRELFSREERREVGWLAIVGTGVPFVLGLTFGSWLIRPALAGPHGNRVSLIIILAVGVAVTSVPVVSKIFADLKILHTRFARLVLGVAVLEDIVLWLALAVATSFAGTAVLNGRAMSLHSGSDSWIFRSRADDSSPRYQEDQQVEVQCIRTADSGGVRNCGLARVLCGGRCAGCEPRFRSVPRGFRGGA